MADTSQLKILHKGVSAWNNWREKNEAVKIDLSGAKLNKAHIQKINLAKSNLSGADFRNTDLSGANLQESDMFGINLGNADLSKANLMSAYLWGANLVGARLVNAILVEANLSGADFSGADLSWTEPFTAGFGRREIMTSGLIARLLFPNVLHNLGYLKDANSSLLSFLEGEILISPADFSGAILRGVNLRGANLEEVQFINADLSKAHLNNANLSDAKLIGANLRGAELINADLVKTDLSKADLTGADLSYTDMVGTIVTDAIINECNVYGASVWDLRGEFKDQRKLTISSIHGQDRTYITTNNIKDAQFINLILDNPEIRGVLNTLTSKAVLILGRFADDKRKAVLESLRRELRQNNLLPIVFDFDRPEDKDFTETIKTLAGMCYFVIADITSPKSAPLELQATVPDYQIPFVPIIQELEGPFSMMQNLQTKYPWVLDTISYKDSDQLVRILKKGIIERAKKKRVELRSIKAQKRRPIPASQFEE